jgi:hypothetical protein
VRTFRQHFLLIATARLCHDSITTKCVGRVSEGVVFLSRPTSFTDDNNWNGGFYELSIDLGDRDDARLASALERAWDDPRLDGCFADRRREPADQIRVAPTLAAQSESGHLRGVAVLPNGAAMVCGTVVIREDYRGIDWLDLYLPLGALARADGRVGGYPFGSTITTCDDAPSRESLEWRRPIDNWLAGIGSSIFAVAPFRLGLIGFEVSGAELTDIPAERYATYLVPVGGRLVVLPATI